MECEEARYALKPWPIESTVIKKLDMNVCTCNEAWKTEEKAEEIAEEIGQTLLYSQQLREKLALNLHKERQNARKPSLNEIYKPQQSTKHPPRPAPLEKTRNRSQSQHRLDTDVKPAKARSSSSIRQKSTIPQYKSLEPSPDNELARVTTAPTYDRSRRGSRTNFILANKLSVRGKSVERSKAISASCGDVRKLSGSTKHLATSNKSLNTSNKSLAASIRDNELETMNELDKLIKKYAAISVEDPDAKANCPIHGENATGEVEEKVITHVDAVEGLDRVGIPSYMVRILKAYHLFLKEELFEDTPAVTKKQQNAPNLFMENFNRSCNRNKSPLVCQYQELLGAYSTLTDGAFKSNISTHQVKQLKSNFLSLDKFYDEFKVKRAAGDFVFSMSNLNDIPRELSIDMNNLISNGIWNYPCVKELKGLFGSYCTRYPERNQLMAFHDYIQEIQKKVYETELIDLISLTILPKMKVMFDPCSEEFLELYKMICTVVQVINPKSPVLVKSSSED